MTETLKVNKIIEQFEEMVIDSTTSRTFSVPFQTFTFSKYKNQPIPSFPTYPTCLTAVHIQSICNRYNMKTSKYELVSTPTSLITDLKAHSNRKIRGYICHTGFHWFTIIFLNIKKKQYIIYLDSLSSVMPTDYLTALIEFNPSFIFYKTTTKLQFDDKSCGLFALVFLFSCYRAYSNAKELDLSIFTKITYQDLFNWFETIKKHLVNEPITTRSEDLFRGL